MGEPTLLKRSIAEFIGTYVLVFLGTGSVVITVLLFGDEGGTAGDFFVGISMPSWLVISLAFGIAVWAMIYTFGHISGTHINPAVSIALWATGRFPASGMAAYVLAQAVGAYLASLTIVLILGTRATDTGLGATAPFFDVSYWQAIVAETVATFFLMLTIMGAAVDSRAPSGFAGTAIGLVVAGDIIVFGNITGSSLNPARTFGPYLALSSTGGDNLWSKFPIYIIGPIVGAVAAAWLYDWVASTRSQE